MRHALVGWLKLFCLCGLHRESLPFDWFKFSENGALQQSRVGYQLNAAVRAAALDACELLRKLLPPLGIDGPATELEDAARVDAPQCDCQCLEYPSCQY